MKPDLNLLRVFDILMETRNVSRTADRLGLTQSAVSHALARLREQLGDPLFTRSRAGLRPTRRAQEIGASVREGLSRLTAAIAQPGFEAAETTRHFTISASSYFCVTVMPRVIERARAEAPLAQIRIVAPASDLVAGLDDGTIDVALGGFRSHPPRLSRTPLFTEHLVWVGREGSSRSDLAIRPRLALSRMPFQALDEDFGLDAGIEQRIGIVQHFGDPSVPIPVTVHDALSAGALVAGSDLVTLLPAQLAALVAHSRTRIEVLGASDEAPLGMSMLWSNRYEADPGHLWLRTLLIEAAKALMSGYEA